MDPEPDVIRQQIEKTRSSLTDKIETLEEQVKETVSNVTHTVEETISTVKDRVQGTVESVKSTVEETVDTVKRTFDLPYQTERHPWAMTGGSALLGFVLGYSLGGRRRRLPREPRYPAAGPAWDEGLRRGYEPASPAGYDYEAAPEFATSPPPPHRQQPSLLSRLLQPFAAEIGKIKEVAVGGLLSMMRDSVVRSVPPGLANQVEEIMNDLTQRLGGKPVQGPVMPEQAGHEHNGR